MGLSDFASYHADGTKVEDPVFPYKLRFHPTGDIEFPQDYQGDYLNQLKTIKSGSTLWSVYGLDAPEELGGQEHLIGSLVTTADMTTSRFGDETLFFRHELMDVDLGLKPEWEPYFPKWHLPWNGDLVKDTVKSAAAACPFAYLWQ